MDVRRVALSVAAAGLVAGLVVGCSESEDSGGEGTDGGAAAGASAADGAGGGSQEEPGVGEEPAVEEEPAAEDATGDVTIVHAGVMDHDVWGPGAFVVEYEITNSTDEAQNYFASIEFLDADGDVLGSTGVTADQLGPGKTHSGDTAPLPVEIDNGEMADIVEARVSLVDRTPVA